MDKSQPLKVMYLSPVGDDSLDSLFEEMVRENKDIEFIKKKHG